MNLLPDWAPNLHPVLVHFPIGLLLLAIGLDAVSCLLRYSRWLRHVASMVYVLGTLAVVATYLTGRMAAQHVWVPGMAQAIVKDHWDWAFRTVWFFGVLTTARLLVLWPRNREPRRLILAIFALAGLVGAGLVGETGDRGGRLVYQFGVGTTRE